MVNDKIVEKQTPLFSCAHGHEKKRLELYIFVDPLCPRCWEFESMMKKLWIAYGHLFTFRHILTGQSTRLSGTKKMVERTISRLGLTCDNAVSLSPPLPMSYVASLAVKAAELQGRQASIRFLRQLQDIVFIQGKTIDNTDVFVQCAKRAELDIDEFINDLYSPSAIKALHCDLKIAAEMDVYETPTLVLFNERIEEEGIKISGAYSYDIYVELIHDMLGFAPEPSPPPPLEQLVEHVQLISTDEIADIYNIPTCKAECEMKKLLLQQKVEKMHTRRGTYWKVIRQEKGLD